MSTVEQLNELMTRQEDLHPDLREHLCQTPLGLGVKHPFIFYFGLDTKRAALVNAQYLSKKERIERHEKDGEWSRALGFYERPYRLTYFRSICQHLSDQDYWDTLGWVITDSENLWQNDAILRYLLSDPDRIATRYLLMSEDERRSLADMPDEIQIWRGCRWTNRNGLSWTFNKDKAVWFAKRFAYKRPYIHSGTVSKSDVIAHFSARNEDEILAIHTKIRGKKMTALTGLTD